MSEQVINVGMVGFGTVGTGVVKLLLDKGDPIAERTGLRLNLACVVDVDTETPRPVTLPNGVLTADLNALLTNQAIDIGIELVGGTGVAKEIQLKMLRAGKHVVTANKALLAAHGAELWAEAGQQARCIAFEASCAGGIPIVSALRNGLAANSIQGIYGIVNGTCNYILSKMSAEGTGFSETLAEAQARGYAEADPTLDINGEDSAHKLAILSSIAFGQEISLQDILVEGIEGIPIEDIRCGAEMGYSLKLLAIGQKNAQGQISLRVHPSFILSDCALARVSGPFNAVSVFGHAVGETLFYGRGAGMMPTASAVVADIIDVALGNSLRSFQHTRISPREQGSHLIEDIGDCVSRFYIRVLAADRPGVVAKYSQILGDQQISISGVLQHEGTGPDDTVPVVIVTHATPERNMSAALEALARLDCIRGRPVCIRIVDIPEDSDG